MTFDFDPKKSLLNKEKHKIDFIEVQDIWNDPDALKDIPDNYRNGEKYWLTVGFTLGVVWSVIYNIRNGVIHLVSVRKARDLEKEQYEILKNE